jgi:mannose-6-phosphate isomerase-like protein (cupin superfamily)
MKEIGIERAKAFTTLELVDYASGGITTTTIIRKTTGHINIISLDCGETWKRKETSLPFDFFIQIIEGESEVMIGHQQIFVHSGQSIVIPAHCSYSVNARVRVKMICVVIKSGYEEMNL